jgi:glutamate 5-kinase
LLLTDVQGLYDRPPSEEGAVIIDTYSRAASVSIGEKSARGRGGMGAKVTVEISFNCGGLQQRFTERSRII